MAESEKKNGKKTEGGEYRRERKGVVRRRKRSAEEEREESGGPDDSPDESGNRKRKGKRKKYWMDRLFYFFLPFALALVYVIGIWCTMPHDQALLIIGGMGAYSFTPAGPEIVVPYVTKEVMDAGGDSVWHPAIVAFSLAFVDLVFAMFFMWNFDHLLKIPYVGPWMEKVERMGRRRFEANAWVYNFALVGLVLYTAFPFQGSGGAVGSIFGRILGMERKRVFAAITAGACLGAFPFAYLTYWGMGVAGGLLTDEQKMIGGIIVVLLVVVASLYLSKLDEEKYGDRDEEGKGS
jgi:hypothetical protein